MRPAHLRHAATALAAILGTQAPADAVLRELFERHRNAGSRDRARISELVYGVLRSYFPLRAALGDGATPLELCAAHALTLGLALPPLEGADAQGLAQRLAGAPAADAATRHNLPRWLWDRLLAQYGEAQASALAQALNAPATVDLRVNTLKATAAAAREALAADGVEAQATPWPETLRLARRAPLQRTRAFRDGLVEPQDAGSQQLAAFVQARPGETVADFCAGAGGKALALGAHMRNRGAVHAFDTSRARLARLAPRLARSGLSIVTSTALRDERDPKLGPLAGRFDAVLVDAPCSATGTLRRNPELRLRTPDLAALAARQRAILDAAARLVRPGGRLVYATCSVLREENEDVARGFLDAHPELQPQGEPLVLLPHRDGTDGFYAVRFTRK